MGSYMRGQISCGISFPSSVKSGNALSLRHFDCVTLRKREKMWAYPCVGKVFTPFPLSTVFAHVSPSYPPFYIFIEFRTSLSLNHLYH
jgi:hypothetical protein